MVKLGFIACMLLALTTTVSADEHLYFKNRCSHSISLYYKKGPKDYGKIATIKKGATYHKAITGKDHMFRHTSANQATLFEATIDGGKIWHDISIIPPGPGNCNSWANCKAHTKKKGFNVRMGVWPHKNRNGANCRRLVCQGNSPSKCKDGYLFPADNTKTHDCPVGTKMDVVFCPS